MRPLLVLVIAGLVGAACSFTTAGNFTECKADLDCGTTSACSHGYCLPLPQGCRREESGTGAKDAFSVTNRIPLVALLPINALSELDDSEVQSANAMKLAVAEANDHLTETRGLFGLFVCDTDKKIVDGGVKVQAEWFIDNLAVAAFLVSSSGPTNDLAQNAARVAAGTLIMSPNATSPELNIRHGTEGNVWRVAPPDTGQAKVLADLVKLDFPDGGVDGGTTRVPTISIIHTSSVYGRGFANPLGDELVRRGFLAPVHPFDADDANKRTAALRAAVSAEPRATVLIANTSDAVELIKEARATMPILTRDAGHRWYLTDSMKETTLITPDTRGELEGSVGTAPAQGAGAGYSVFREAYRTRFGTDPDTTNYTSHSYDATWLVMLATQYALGNGTTLGAVTGPRLGEGMTRFALATGPYIPLRSDKWSELADNLARGTAVNVEGASGPLDFSVDAGAPGAPYEIWKIADGGIRVLRQVWP